MSCGAIAAVGPALNIIKPAINGYHFFVRDRLAHSAAVVGLGSVSCDLPIASNCFSRVSESSDFICRLTRMLMRFVSIRIVSANAYAVRFGPDFGGRIRQAPMDFHRLSGPDRTGLSRSIGAKRKCEIQPWGHSGQRTRSNFSNEPRLRRSAIVPGDR